MGRHPEIDLLFHEGESQDLAEKLRRPQDLLFLRKWDDKMNPSFDFSKMMNWLCLFQASLPWLKNSR
ncbi:hypothetical protein FYJ62_05340 [Lactobacillus porci]|uniref:Uncharacterized protein n=2 Tax=Lactobacillus porci TaxID=2012477 RepID=A0A6A8ME72_9LACO|nr:hypothetical protein [Lactobacillus porci]